MTIEKTAGTPSLLFNFFDETNALISSNVAVAFGTSYVKENIPIPDHAVYFRILAQSSNITAVYSKSILTYGDILGDYSLDYYNKIFFTEQYARVNLLNTFPAIWEVGTTIPNVSLDQAYSPSNLRVRLKLPHVLKVEAGKSLYWKIPGHYKIGVGQYDANRQFIASMGLNPTTESSIALSPATTFVTILLAYTNDAPIAPTDISIEEIYVGYSPSIETSLSSQINNLDKVRSLIGKNCALTYTGHSGALGYAPENTLEAFELSRLFGMTGAETDILMTADGHIVLMHDETIDRTTTGTGRVADLTLVQIKSCNVSQSRYSYNVKVPTLEEFMALCRSCDGLIPRLEIKPYPSSNIPNLVAEMIRIVKNYNMIDFIMVTSFSADILREVRRQNKDLLLGLIRSNGLNYMQQDLALSRELGNFAICLYDYEPPDITAVTTQEQVDTYHANGIYVSIGISNLLEEEAYFPKIGVDTIVTNVLPNRFRNPVKYSADIRTTDGGTTWEFIGAIIGTSISFDKTLGSKKLGVVFQ
ncbi:glycerophosphodiester phosphodiesterase [Paenibacillus sp. GCM10012303]|uniref:glycerophosphodiester phosphodiesterase n=1 Tax=Paenibacillus sp. GCM10012303 TaxID=3317340 RepID=UPI003621874A